MSHSRSKASPARSGSCSAGASCGTSWPWPRWACSCCSTCWLEAFAAFVAGNEVVQPNHVGRGVVEFLAVFRAGAARKLLFLAADFPADGKLEIFVAAWTNKLRLPDFLFFRIE